MPELDVDGIVFTFPDDWLFTKYDEWQYYRAYAGRQSGTKAVDLIAVNDGTAWFIEVKDYRVHPRTKLIDLPHEIAQKVHDTLAVVLAARTKALTIEEKRMANKVSRATRLRVVLHLEQPAKHSKLFPRAIDPADVKLKMRKLLKQIDAHPLVVDSNNLRGLSWTTE